MLERHNALILTVREFRSSLFSKEEVLEVPSEPQQEHFQPKTPITPSIRAAILLGATDLVFSPKALRGVTPGRMRR
jgi:hypothetical protein